MMMVRMRWLWFIAGAVVADCIWEELRVDRNALASDMEKKFHALEARISNLESSSSPSSSSFPNNHKIPVSDKVEG